ncbi:hypothetical protein GCM10011531_26400 [Aquaticitalea lipolytica]|uniref:Uncharacterized protein n=1 Tax=Aquaticitalea lipolytica TaxID=1247562 RepID=A0A8J2XH85_9FLAO|nr:hypothetical protein [Aquaticitalea lipolytica]GFZ93087.1 hypothetical protein GCM10011531_26400 [Aquaticitalea lipolytica]
MSDINIKTISYHTSCKTFKKPMRKIYDYVFFSIYRSLNITNKSIPEWSAIILISLLLFVNIFSILIYIDYDIKSIGKKGFGIITSLLIGLNYLYFLKGKRYLIILNRFDEQKNKLICDSIVLLYACISVFTFLCFLGIELERTSYMTGFVALSALIPFMFTNIKK